MTTPLPASATRLYASDNHMRNFMDCVRSRGHPAPARRAAARVTAVALVLLIPMHWVETYFIFTGMATLFWITAGLAVAGLSEPGIVPARSTRRARQPRAAIAPG